MKTRLAVAALLCGMLSFPLNAKDVCLMGADGYFTLSLKLNGLHFKKGATGNFSGLESMEPVGGGAAYTDLITGVYYVRPDGKQVSY